MKVTMIKDALIIQKKREPRQKKAEQYAATRLNLVAAARKLFAERGFGETGTEDLVAEAGITRGALYYHFTDKQDIFRATLEDVSQEIDAFIKARSTSPVSALDGLIKGCEAFVEIARQPAIYRIYLLDGPAILGWTEWRKIDGQFAAASLRDAVHRAMPGINDNDQLFLTMAISGMLNEVASLAAQDVKLWRRATSSRFIERALSGMIANLATSAG
jgi:AcrR family transcriptional regulator